MVDIPCPKCGAPSCPLTKSTRKRTVARCRGNLVERYPHTMAEPPTRPTVATGREVTLDLVTDDAAGCTREFARARLAAWPSKTSTLK